MLACVIYSAKLTFMEISLATIINMGINDIPISPADPVIKQYSFSLKYISYKAYYSLTSLYIYIYDSIPCTYSPKDTCIDTNNVASNLVSLSIRCGLQITNACLFNHYRLNDESQQDSST